jgi:hypothetical protein
MMPNGSGKKCLILADKNAKKSLSKKRRRKKGAEIHSMLTKKKKRGE